MSSLACQNPIKRRCTVNRHTPAKPGAIDVFSVPVSVTLADSEKNYRVSHFTTTQSTDRPLTPPPPGERQKLITFPLTAEKSSFIDLQLARR
jgi:hypothetical protein